MRQRCGVTAWSERASTLPVPTIWFSGTWSLKDATRKVIEETNALRRHGRRTLTPRRTEAA